LNSLPSLSPALPQPPAADLVAQFARRRSWYLAFIAALVAIYALPLTWLARHAAGSDLHSHTLLIPFVCLYLLYIQRERLPRKYVIAPFWSALFAIIGIVTLVGAWGVRCQNAAVSFNDNLALFAFSFVCLVIAGGLFFLGQTWMRAAAFPMAFLIFMVPMPDAMADYLEEASKLGSAEVASMLFAVTGTPVLRDGTIFQLPGISLEVAKECSGIRSSYVLFITSLLASYLFLSSPLRRGVLVASIIPLGLLRNGIRILTIALLCVHMGPHMIHSVIHRRGGPFFFAASLIPLFVLLWWLRRGEERRKLNPESRVSARRLSGT
jgi:exosortase C (VPDSG-CTERM-specific)